MAEIVKNTKIVCMCQTCELFRSTDWNDSNEGGDRRSSISHLWFADIARAKQKQNKTLSMNFKSIKNQTFSSVKNLNHIESFIRSSFHSSIYFFIRPSMYRFIYRIHSFIGWLIHSSIRTIGSNRSIQKSKNPNLNKSKTAVCDEFQGLDEMSTE